jgi:hypothetical protein
VVVSVAVGRSAQNPVVVFFADVELAADDRLNPRGLGGVHEMHGAKNIAMIGHGYRWHAKFFGAIAELLDVAGAVEHGIVSMKMKVNELRHPRKLILLCLGGG